MSENKNQLGNLQLQGQDVWIPKVEYEELKQKAEAYDAMVSQAKEQLGFEKTDEKRDEQE